ncbi:hypothetical protein [Methyloceanibacter stevinii]|nr:hypothetical protein [Methyloceanibacter stevinii]
MSHRDGIVGPVLVAGTLTAFDKAKVDRGRFGLAEMRIRGVQMDALNPQP